MELDLTIKRPALRYHGSKFRLAPWIIQHFPELPTYCEPFGGAASVLLRKPAARTEIYNDLDSEVVNFFTLLRDPISCSRLAQVCEFTPFSREEYHSCFEPSTDPLERARRFVARAFMGFGTHSHNIENDSNGFRTFGPLSKKNYALEWCGIPDNLLAVASRFSKVVIEHLPALLCLSKYDSPDTLFYVDPPYVHSLRDDTHRGYAHEMSDQSHRDLAWALHQVKGKVVCSGYPGALYSQIFADWRRAETTTTANGQKGQVTRTEVIWLNF